MKNKKIETWRIVVFTISVLFILFLWTRKGFLDVYVNTPKEHVLPLLFTSIGVSLIKFIFIVMIALLIKWIINKYTKNR